MIQSDSSEQKKAQQPPQMPHRYCGVAKVTGKARYAAEFREPFPKDQLLHAYIVQATIPCGSVAAMDSGAAEKASGVIAVLTPFNAGKQINAEQPEGRRILSILQDTTVSYSGQPIAVVVAKSLDQAKFASTLLRIRYDEQPAKLDFAGRMGERRPPRQGGRGPANATAPQAPPTPAGAIVMENTYITPVQVHNPMEPHATIAWWQGDKLTVYDSTQGVSGVHAGLARVFQLPHESVHVIDPYVGGGFGCKGNAWSHVFLSAMAARHVGKPVQLALERPQMFGPVGYRPMTVNKIRLAAQPDGKLQLIEQNVTLPASVLEDFVERSDSPARRLYSSKIIRTSVGLVDMNWGPATYMRAPGESSGTAVFEIAMDELAEKLKMDPVALRLANYAETDPTSQKPWTSKHLRECYQQAAERFGWSRRNATPGQVTEGNCWIGYGMATALYPANRSAASAVARFNSDGNVYIGCGTQDLGTGTYSVLAQTAAANLGLDPLKIEVQLGDSTLPRAPGSGGSQSAASVGPAVDDACTQLKLKVISVAVADVQSPLHGAANADIEVKGRRLFLKNNPAKGEDIAALIARHGGQPIEAEGSAEPSHTRETMSAVSFGAVFAEVAVDKTTHMVKVRRVCATYDIGTLINNQTGLNQLMGGIVWGVGFALTEEAVHDPHYGRMVNENLGEYHVPVNADIGTLDVTVLNIPDTNFNPLGARGIGEIGITGAAAAVANAVYNATGKRVREYPITPDKLMNA